MNFFQSRLEAIFYETINRKSTQKLREYMTISANPWSSVAKKLSLRSLPAPLNAYHNACHVELRFAAPFREFHGAGIFNWGALCGERELQILIIPNKQKCPFIRPGFWLYYESIHVRLRI
ncbi:MAG: hypothetical protein GY864_13910 [Desulfobacterales bacterium]|nr:hypothetical protein [Desulfobacterales bacterium]